MSARERLANACILPSFPGSSAPDWIRRFLDDGGAGVMLFAHNVDSRDELATLAAELHGSRDDVLLAIDEEGGDVTRLEWRSGSSYPGAAALGAVDDLAATRAVAASIAAELAAVGVNWNLAPVADVNVPGNPVIGVRAFGDDAVVVARHVAAFVEGTQSRRVAACAKHFPGHGATTQDSHLELPTVTGSVDAALSPFRAALAAGARSVMTAHVLVPDLDERPATLSDRVVSGLLRRELGFEGVIVSDALDMRAIGVDAPEAAVAAVEAGVDVLIMGQGHGACDVERVRRALARDVSDGRLAEAAGRVRALGAWARPLPAGVDRSAAADVARRALAQRGDVRIARGAQIVELRATANIAAGEAEHSLAAVVVREGEDVPRADVFVVRDAHRHPWMQAAADVRGAVVIETGLPLWEPAAARGHIATYGGSRASYEAVAELIR